MSKMKIGIQLYSLRKFLKTPSEVADTFKKVKAMNAEVVQVSGMCKIDARELQKILIENQLPICITHVSYDRLTNELDKVIEEHKIFGCKNVGIGMMPSSVDKSKLDEIKKFCDFLNNTSDKLRKENMTMSYHNHGFEFKKVNGEIIYDFMLKNTNKEVLFIPDTFWIKQAGANPVEYLKKLEGRINTVHLKDHKKILGVSIMKPIGDGKLDFSEILKVSQNSGAENAVVELDFAKDAFSALDKSLKYIKTIY